MTNVSQTNTSSLLAIKPFPRHQPLLSRISLSPSSFSGINTLQNKKVTVLHRNNQESQSLPFQYLIKVSSRIFSDILYFLLQICKVLYKFKQSHKKSSISNVQALSTSAYLNFCFKKFYNWRNSVIKLEMTHKKHWGLFRSARFFKKNYKLIKYIFLFLPNGLIFW